jgi:hypothetical protein
MTPEEFKKLREIVEKKYHELVPFRRSEEPWNELCDSLRIRRVSGIMNKCAPPELGELRIPEPYGGFLSMDRNTAKKILVLGM